VVTALYRRYRPETFAELIGQAQVTDPLQHALETDRVNHAYLFSGPRGCGKTTSARILARCLNCEQGPTGTPCGTCPSCQELSRDGGGSLDVVEIDAASHNGVDDARELRERAVFAPARDRYKIFILDEAHMVTPQGFNALLKIVEEPPPHVKFIFATTEPDKVIGTIRSRTHHYPFRLVPPADLLSYVEQLCATEGVSVETGVLPLVVRAGGGSVRDTLSVLDQLIAGSTDNTVVYDRAVALLGYTHGELLATVVQALAAQDGSGTFQALDRVIHTGQDPRRFAEDLLEYVRDLIVVDAAKDQAAGLLPGISAAALEQMAEIASGMGSARLSAIADVVNEALSSMTGATSPKLHLELLMARLLVALGDSTPSTPTPPSQQSPVTPQQVPPAVAESEPAPSQSTPPEKPLGLEMLESSWPAIVEQIAQTKRVVWTALLDTQVVALDADVVTIGFPALSAADILKKPQGPGLPPNAELVREAIKQVTGHRVRFKVVELPRAEEVKPAELETEVQTPVKTAGPEFAAPAVESAVEAAEPDDAGQTSWPTVTPPSSEVPIQVSGGEEHVEATSVEYVSDQTSQLSQVGEAVIREVLGGQLISEHRVDEPGEK
jgi:DNA polymerase III subunit gamma/tau